ncbi:NAD(P)H-dependent oxidoreductase [Derxia lacustris]|uniref:NAD(P)H-dependent oxidoreductase n=1 Tax=Derxia lacustris TaxID=764842 RepID=UPI000A17039A|nr:NAD(P)H-dependent oxidoreductase [Derxia lacustris]
MASIAVVYFSGYGHTAKVAEAVAAGAAQVEGATVELIAVDAEGNLTDAQFASLTAADAIVFGAPTYMGNVPWQFKKFADASSKLWYTRAWENKIAGGFTNSASFNGDKAATLSWLITFALQHGMVWVGSSILPANSSKAVRDDLNRLGSFAGVMTQSDSDLGADVVPPKGDLATAEAYGKRIAGFALKR